MWVTMSTNKKLILQQIVFVASSETPTFRITAFPLGIEQILVTYFQMAYYAFLIPYKLEENSDLKQYAIRSGKFRKVVSRSLQSIAVLQFILKIIPAYTKFRLETTLGIFFLFGWLGRVIAMLTFLGVLHRHKNRITHLINSLMSEFSSEENVNFYPPLGQNLKKNYGRRYQFMTRFLCILPVILPLVTFNPSDFQTRSPVVELLVDAISGSEEALKHSFFLRTLCRTLEIFEFLVGTYNEILYNYFLMLGVLTALTMLLICNKFVDSLVSSKYSQMLTDETKVKK
ncbi:unnamed protein product [Orchesella dallaii]|uniref:Uncharacterized protein n=1 Tax=Orchesella dallaii TaxID=48710 RepID=A0ABP1R3T0_9HEXA